LEFFSVMLQGIN